MKMSDMKMEDLPFKTAIVLGCETFYIHSFVKLTRRQVRQEASQFRNGTHWLFDRHCPPALQPGMKRMKGAKAAYARRPNNWEEWETMFGNHEEAAGDENYAIKA